MFGQLYTDGTFSYAWQHMKASWIVSVAGKQGTHNLYEKLWCKKVFITINMLPFFFFFLMSER